MSECYIQPYEPLNSTAKLVRLPKNEPRSRSVGRSFWTRLLASSNPSSHATHPHLRRSESPSSTSSRSLNSTVIINDSSQRSSRSSIRSSQSSFSQPMARPRTSVSGNSVSGSNISTNIKDSSNLESRNINTPLQKSKTTVTVHLSKTNKANSTPNLAEATQCIDRRKPSQPTNRRVSESQNWNSPIKENKRSSSVSSFKNIESLQNSLGSNSSVRNESPQLELNSLQVFRQPKYRERKKAERKIRQLEHLNQNKKCDELVNQLGKGVHHNTYENQNKLNLVNFINEDGFITSCRRGATVTKHSTISQKPKLPPPLPPPVAERRVFGRDHVYTEIKEDHLRSFPERTIVKTPPVFRKKVTFSTFHEPVLESDPFTQNRKILPATFWGIVQVTEALRSRADEDRRRVAHLCFHAISTGAEDHSLTFLGKVDNSRHGQCVYMVLDENSFEIRDGDGLVIVKHGFRDISVVVQIKDDPCLFVYVGRCKFNGRVSVTIRFNKSKHASMVLNSFGNRSKK